jgi:hypothetical protein
MVFRVIAGRFVELFVNPSTCRNEWRLSAGSGGVERLFPVIWDSPPISLLNLLACLIASETLPISFTPDTQART